MFEVPSRLTGVEDPAAEYHYTYDNLGRVTQQTQEIAGLTPMITLNQKFDAASNRTELNSVIGSSNDFKNTYAYDNLNRMTQVIQQGNSGNTVAAKRVDFSYNAAGQFSQINRYQSTGTSDPVALSVFTYDGIGRMLSQYHQTGISTTLASYDYTYDAASRITSIDSSVEGLSSFTYDVTNQLTGADHASPRVDESYSYDDNGNRTMSGYTTGDNNQTMSDGTYNYEYDHEGNMVKKTTISTGDYEAYDWDHRNRLTTVTFKNSSHVTQKTVENTYDLYNRWVRRRYDSDGPGATAAVDQFFAYDGYEPVLEFDGPAAADLTHRYLWGPAVDQILADENVTSLGSAGNILWPATDHLGTPRDIIDLNEGSGVASVTNHRTYNSFGVRTAETNSAVDLIFGVEGKIFDEVTKTYNHLNRIYNPALGQWESEDPIVFEGGNTNLRRDVWNSPLNWIDPDGLEGKMPVTTRPPVKIKIPVGRAPTPAPSSARPSAASGASGAANQWAQINGWAGVIARENAQLLSDVEKSLDELVKAGRLCEADKEEILKGVLKNSGGEQNSTRNRQKAIEKYVRNALVVIDEKKWENYRPAPGATDPTNSTLENSPNVDPKPKNGGKPPEVPGKKKQDEDDGETHNLSTVGMTEAEKNAVIEYAIRTNAWLLLNGPATVRSTKTMSAAKKAAIDAEYARARRAGTPYPTGGQLGHVPDTCLTGNPVPPAGWIYMPGYSNSYVGGTFGPKVGRKIKVITVDGHVPIINPNGD